MPVFPPNISPPDAYSREAFLLWQGNAGDSFNSHVRPQRIVAVLHRNEAALTDVGAPARRQNRVVFVVEMEHRDALGDVHWQHVEMVGDAAVLALVQNMHERQHRALPLWLVDWMRAQDDRPVVPKWT